MAAARKSSGTAGFKEELSCRKYTHSYRARTCVDKASTPLRVAGDNTLSVDTEFPGESHGIGCRGVLEGLGEAIGLEGDSTEGENKSALLGGRALLIVTELWQIRGSLTLAG